MDPVFFPGMSLEAAILINANAARSTARVYNYISGGLVFRPRSDGLEALINGFGAGLKVGDLILISNLDGSGLSRYRLTEIRYSGDPADLWFAEARFDRRTRREMDHDAPYIKRCAQYWDCLRS